MKKAILFLVAGISSLAFGQNVTENKVSFSFIQLPTNPISTDYNTYNVIVEKKYEKANEDSLNAYALRLDAATQDYEARMVAWKEQVKVMKKDYLTKMSAWQKATNAGTPSNTPVEPTYPLQPVMTDVKYPNLHSDIDDNTVSQAIQLAGYERGDGGATITIGIQSISNMSISKNVKKTSTSTKYEFSAKYKLPIEVKVEDPSSGVVLQTIILNSMLSHSIGTYDSEYDFDLWWLDNEETFWLDFEKRARTRAITEANTFINNKCGFPVKSRVSEVYTIKKFKDHQYGDLVNAYTVASQGYQQISQKKDRSSAISKLQEAITIWQTALKESNLGDRKARINDKVTAMLYCNIAEAYIWLAQFDKAEQYINQAIGVNVGKFKRAAERLRGLLNERKSRWNTNY